MKKLLLAALVVLALAGSAQAQGVLPAPFQGKLVDAEDGPGPHIGVTITSDKIQFGTSDACKITRTEGFGPEAPYTEYVVYWRCPVGTPATGYVQGGEIKVVFQLKKIMGKTVLVTVGTDDPPMALGFYQRR